MSTESEVGESEAHKEVARGYQLVEEGDAVLDAVFPRPHCDKQELDCQRLEQQECDLDCLTVSADHEDEAHTCPPDERDSGPVPAYR